MADGTLSYSMNTRYTLPRTERLKSRTRIERLFKEGKGGFVYPLRYVFLEEGEVPAASGGVAVMVSVSKRHHKRANMRNLLKRRMREAYRLNKPGLAEKYAAGTKGLSLGLLYASNEAVDYSVIENAVKKIIRTFVERN